jgi:hypothetical protein
MGDKENSTLGNTRSLIYVMPNKKEMEEAETLTMNASLGSLYRKSPTYGTSES